MLLSICIPTYNRCYYLDRLLKTIFDQYTPNLDIEVFVSDNCSIDETQQIVIKYINLKFPIRYKRNDVNIGPDLNIAQCYTNALGKYVLVFGDDDIFLKGALKKITNCISNGEYGIIYMNFYGFTKNWDKERPKINLFKKNYQYSNLSILKIIRSRIGFISASIINTAAIDKEKLIAYAGTNFNQVPIIVNAIQSFEKHIYIGDFLIAQQQANSGGFQYFKIMGFNYYQVLSDTVNGDKAVLRWFANDLIVNFFPWAILQGFKNEKDSIFEKNAIEIIKPIYEKYFLFWIFNYPLFLLPKLIRNFYFFCIKGIALVIKKFIWIPKNTN